MRSLVDGLLKRCILETNETNRLKLATCLGEIGALDPNYMGQDTSTRKVESKGIVNEKNHLITTDDNWMLGNGAPWKCRSVKIHYKLQLVTNYFVISLKAAPTPTDQHKIAFAIQEGKSALQELVLVFAITETLLFSLTASLCNTLSA